MSIEAMKQALEVLEDFVDDPRAQHQIDAASAALRQAIAEAEKQEAVAYLLRRQDRSGYETGEKTDYGAFPVYTASQQHTWIGLTDEDCERMSAGDKVVAMWAERTLKKKNTHPQPKREWVGLTDEQIAEFFGVKAVDESFVDFVRAIEAAHGIKENKCQ